MDSSPILEVNHVTKTYPKTGIVALDDVTLAVRRGEIHGVVGELGVGKTTLMKILGGLIPAGSYQGEILFEGSPLAARSTWRRDPAGDRRGAAAAEYLPAAQRGREHRHGRVASREALLHLQARD